MDEKPIARCFFDLFKCPKHPPGWVLFPAAPPVTKVVDGFWVARLGDYGMCDGDSWDIVVEGSDSMLVCGLPIARKGDAMMHGGTISMGSDTEGDAGGTFRLPANLKIGGDIRFQNKVVRDLYAVSQTPAGAATLNAIAASGQDVAIVSGGYIQTAPDDPDAVRRGGKSGSTIDYDPDKLDINTVCKEGCVANPPQLNLGHELIHAARFARGGATMNNITEEKQVIGPPYGPTDKDPNWPTENGLRNGLNLGTRLNYDNCTNPQLARNLRPGNCAP